MNQENKETRREKLELDVIPELLHVGLYQKVNAICKKHGIKEYRTGPIQPKGPDENHVFYLHDYYPKGTRNHPYSEKIRSLKNGSEEAAYDFAMELLGVIQRIRDLSGSKRFHLVCIPSHEKRTESRMNRCISYLLELNDDPSLCLSKDKVLLIRSEDVPPSHLGNNIRPSEDTQFCSLCSIRSSDEVLRDVLLLLDDVTTTGHQMNAARKHLLNLGFDEKRLISLVLGKTVTKEDIR